MAYNQPASYEEWINSDIIDPKVDGKNQRPFELRPFWDLVRRQGRYGISNEVKLPIMLHRESWIRFASTGGPDGDFKGSSTYDVVRRQSATARTYQIETKALVTQTLVNAAQHGKGDDGLHQLDVLAKTVSGIKATMAHVMEICGIYGQYPLATTTAVSSSAGAATLTLAPGTTAKRLWFYAKNQLVDIFSDWQTGSKINSNGDAKIVSFDEQANTVSLSVHASDVTAINALTVAYVFIGGMNGGNGAWRVPTGLLAHAAASDLTTNPGGSVVNGISTANDIWRWYVHNANGVPASFALAQEAIFNAVAKGTEGDISLMCGENAMARVNQNLAAHQYIESAQMGGKAYQVGFGKNQYFFAGTNFRIKPIMNPYMPRDLMLAFQDKYIKPFGPSEPYIAGRDGKATTGNDFLRHATDQDYSIVANCDMGLLQCAPGPCVYIRNMDNS